LNFFYLKKLGTIFLGESEEVIVVQKKERASLPIHLSAKSLRETRFISNVVLVRGSDTVQEFEADDITFQKIEVNSKLTIYHYKNSNSPVAIKSYLNVGEIFFYFSSLFLIIVAYFLNKMMKPETAKVVTSQ